LHFQVVIIGAGPAGLACAKILSENGVKTLLVDKKKEIGAKVCAGGLTWSGLARTIPQDLIERSFPVQHIKTRLQEISVQAPAPIIVTVNRKRLGRFMLEQAIACGTEILPATRLVKVSDHTLILLDIQTNNHLRVTFDYLVGADGSNSMVRRHLALPSERMGIGINYQIPGQGDRMEWHLDNSSFKNGYAWIFPHRQTLSVGAYVDRAVMKAQELKQNLIRWADSLEIDLTQEKCDAEYINFDYRGWDFGHIFLTGDAAGLASALTGEGIYPAVVSGEMAAQKIIDPNCNLAPINRLLRKQRLHAKLVRLTGQNGFANILLGELAVFGLRVGLLNFRQLEMAE
jgi:menaquinone-9 beta-reductase